MSSSDISSDRSSSISSLNEYESNTTANGDGLIINKNQVNIFELIEKIKNSNKDSSDSDSDLATNPSQDE